jgi:nucleoside-diphosphate kinase
MLKERTLSIIKPDATKRGLVEDINARFEQVGLYVIAHKKMQFTPEQAAQFYLVHKERPFYDDLVQMMSSGPVVVQVIEGENAVTKMREIMGATNPKEAASGTIRGDFGLDIEQNSVHGSDSKPNAVVEISFFFSKKELEDLNK